VLCEGRLPRLDVTVDAPQHRNKIEADGITEAVGARDEAMRVLDL